MKFDSSNSTQFDIVGRSTKYTDVDNPDWVPSLNLGYEKEVIVESSDHASYQRHIM